MYFILKFNMINWEKIGTTLKDKICLTGAYRNYSINKNNLLDAYITNIELIKNNDKICDSNDCLNLLINYINYLTDNNLLTFDIFNQYFVNATDNVDIKKRVYILCDNEDEDPEDKVNFKFAKINLKSGNRFIKIVTGTYNSANYPNADVTIARRKYGRIGYGRILPKLYNIIQLCKVCEPNNYSDYSLKINLNDRKISEFMEKAPFMQIYGNYIIDSIRTEFENENGYKQIVLTGAPGTGKTFNATKYVEDAIKRELFNNTADEIKNEFKKRYEFVQFHPSYDYSDFVEGLRPVVLEGDSEKNLTFVRMDGIFKAFCRRALKDIEHKYYFIIDEINRADLSKVFGELMYCLEKSKRGDEHYVKTQYQNLNTYFIDDKVDDFKDGFYIPKNVYIIGTMNDIDKSVESFDFALRRRFRWININANDVMFNGLFEMYNKTSNTEIISKLADNIKKMNLELKSEDLGLSEDYYIGHAYFSGLNEAGDEHKLDEINLESNLKHIFDTNISPIIKEYLRGYPEEFEKIIEKCKKALLGNNEEEIDNNEEEE